MKYYPLEVVDHMSQSEEPEMILQSMKDRDLCDKDATVEDLHNYTFGLDFFNPKYDGKFKKWNDVAMYDVFSNKLLFPMIKMENIDQRQTEWKDIISIGQVLDMWKRFKMVYKIDSDFFHEIKNTENLITSAEIFTKLPFDCFYIDLNEVSDISDFRGAWVYVHHEDNGLFDQFIGVNVYMVRSDDFTFFTYYSWYNFTLQNEIQWKPDDLPESDFVARSLAFDDSEVNGISCKAISDRFDAIADHDPRKEIITTIFQIMSFIAFDASDIEENSVTKSTYKPLKENSVIKNKFSEVRMWDIGVRYGKAIRLAKKEYKQHIEKLNGSHDYPKDRKPTRPHVRRAHWHKYCVGKGRTQTKILWIAPVYVCGNHEIPVTIREIKK